MSIQVLEGDLFDTTAKYICHQVNCKGKMGSGVAKQIRERYPEAYHSYRRRCEIFRNHGQTVNMLGQVLQVATNDGRVICNLFAQNDYGYNGACYTDYDAFHDCLMELRKCVPAGSAIAMPYRIGCGLGGGDWDIVRGFITGILSERYTVELWRKE